MTPVLPDWYCERHEAVVNGISDEADPAEVQRCPHCHKHTVIWMTRERWEERMASHQGHCPTLEVKEAQADLGISPAQVQASKETAAEAFARMRQVVAEATDYLPKNEPEKP